RPNHFLTHCPSLHLIPHSVPTRRSSDLLATRGDRHYWQTLPGSERGNVSRYALLVSAFALLPLAANAQELPARTIRIIVPSPPGAAGDITARVIAQKLSERLHQPVVVENQGGASGAIGMSMLRRAAPDGTTIGVVIALAQTIDRIQNKTG